MIAEVLDLKVLERMLRGLIEKCLNLSTRSEPVGRFKVALYMVVFTSFVWSRENST